ncbi:TetR/AcrR family transcriptional regulator [Arenivirga flava]|uniref:TetR family transcriptional regulator n=1 Tax=Arenivirga flava TaxID=1930060 RepID=A0AA37UGP1_9MICO|nr:TetR/AcrR family transcriptional regulator [Arenivirga flava]GMA27102.1 TetR family transcriptional regulator [Arenivirga flava]
MTTTDAGGQVAARARGPYAKTAERRLAILEAATEVFAERGWRAASLRQIAEAAGISLSTLQHHFPSKVELLHATMTHRDEHRFERAPGALPSFPQTVVGQAVANEGVPRLIQLYSVLTAESATAEHPARDYFAQRFASLREEYAAEFAALGAAGALRPGVDPATAAALLIGLWDGVQLQWLHDPDAIEPAEALVAYLGLVIDDEALLPSAAQRARWRSDGIVSA